MYAKGTSLVAEVKLNLVNHLGIPKAYRYLSLKFSLCIPVSLLTPRMGTFNLELIISLEKESCVFSFNSLLMSLIGKQSIEIPLMSAAPCNL